jgi:hypothetical protein
VLGRWSSCECEESVGDGRGKQDLAGKEHYLEECGRSTTWARIKAAEGVEREAATRSSIQWTSYLFICLWTRRRQERCCSGESSAYGSDQERQTVGAVRWRLRVSGSSLPLLFYKSAKCARCTGQPCWGADEIVRLPRWREGRGRRRDGGCPPVE